MNFFRCLLKILEASTKILTNFTSASWIRNKTWSWRLVKMFQRRSSKKSSNALCAELSSIVTLTIWSLRKIISLTNQDLILFSKSNQGSLSSNNTRSLEKTKWLSLRSTTPSISKNMSQLLSSTRNTANYSKKLIIHQPLSNLYHRKPSRKRWAKIRKG